MRSRTTLRLDLAGKAALAAAAIAAVAAQEPSGKRLTFDVASVKPAAAPSGVYVDGERTMVRKGSGAQIPRNTGGPGTADPGRIHYPLISLKALLKQAWNSYHDIEGPGWLDTQTVAVDATMPPDTTGAQFQEMLRNLVIDRFALKYHAATKEVTGYVLVLGRNGVKMKESADQSGGAWARIAAPTGRDPDGFPIVPPSPGHWLVTFGRGDRSRTVGQQVTIQELAGLLGHTLNAIVTDATGLTKRYDFTVTYASGEGPGQSIPPSQPAGPPDAAAPAPDVVSAVQSQLGLKLEQKKVPVEILVVDHMEKTPGGN